MADPKYRDWQRRRSAMKSTTSLQNRDPRGDRVQAIQAQDYAEYLRFHEQLTATRRAEGFDTVDLELHDDISPLAMAQEAMKLVRQWHAEHPNHPKPVRFFTKPGPGMYGDTPWLAAFQHHFERLYYDNTAH